MTTTSLAPLPIQRFVDSNGNALSGGLVFTYAAGTTTKQATYTDSTGGTPNTNPIVLNSRGEAGIWFNPLLSYKVVLSPSTDTDPPTNPIWTVDNVSTYSSLAASNINITASWSGGTSRSVQNAVLNGAYPVRFSGATGIGAADDSTAFINTRNAIYASRVSDPSASGYYTALGWMQIDPGVYLLQSNNVFADPSAFQSFTQGYAIRGASRTATILNWNPSATGYLINNVDDWYGMEISDLTIYGNPQTGQTANFLYSDRVSSPVQGYDVSRVNFKGTWGIMGSSLLGAALMHYIA